MARPAALLTRLALCLGPLAGCALFDAPRPPSGPTGKVTDPTRSLVKLGDAMQAGGDQAGALDFYRAASQRDGGNEPALQRAGQSFMALGQAPRAEQADRAALVLDGGDAAAKRGLAVALLAQHRPQEALPLLDQLVAAHPDPQMLANQGAALDMLGRSAEAQAAYRRGLALAPADSDLHGNLALSLAASGDMASALSEIQAAVAAPNPDPRQESNAVLILALAGRAEDARSRGRGSLGPEPTEALIARAAQVHGAATPAARAEALGLITGAPGSAAPPPTSPAIPATDSPPPPVRMVRRHVSPATRVSSARPAKVLSPAAPSSASPSLGPPGPGVPGPATPGSVALPSG